MHPEMEKLVGKCGEEPFFRAMLVVGVIECVKTLKWIAVILAVMAVCGLWQCSDYSGYFGGAG